MTYLTSDIDELIGHVKESVQQRVIYLFLFLSWRALCIYNRRRILSCCFIVNNSHSLSHKQRYFPLYFQNSRRCQRVMLTCGTTRGLCTAVKLRTESRSHVSQQLLTALHVFVTHSLFSFILLLSVLSQKCSRGGIKV